MIYFADFETTTQENDCRVWSASICKMCADPIPTAKDFINIDSFMKHIEQLYGRNKVFFTNLKFDGNFIIAYMLRQARYHLYKGEDFYKNAKPFDYDILVDGSGQWFFIQIMTPNGCVTIQDSLKAIPLSVADTAKAFGLPIEKGEINYTMFRPVGYQPTDEEWYYIHRDIAIPAMAMNQQYEQGLTKMTCAANAMYDFKNLYTDFDKDFPLIDEKTDSEIRQSYRGGWCYCRKEQEVRNGKVYDVNSLYPSRMKFELLPYGMPERFEGEYSYDPEYPLCVQHISFRFALRKNHPPCIQIKRSSRFAPTEYLEHDDGRHVEMWVTNVDLELYRECYYLEDVRYYGGYKFRGKHDIFKDYIDKWMQVKIEASKTGNKGLRFIAKRMLNSLYGKFGMAINSKRKYPYLDENGIVKWTYEFDTRDPVYIPMATFITAYARAYTIRAAIACWDRFCYADTDSLHIIGTDEAPLDFIDDNALGAWSNESNFVRAKFIRQKTYAEEDENGIIEYKCAGLPDRAKAGIEWGTFAKGAKFGGKLLPKVVKGGIILVESTFEIKE